MLSLRYSQAGDTIVEVLIAMMITGLMLVSAFITVNHTSMSERQAQERGEGLQLVQSQLEALRGCIIGDDSCVLSNGSPYNPTAPPATFCIYQTLNIILPGANPNDCEVNSTGIYDSSVQPVYNLSVTESATATGTVYTAQAKWSQIGGGTENVILEYKVY